MPSIIKEAVMSEIISIFIGVLLGFLIPHLVFCSSLLNIKQNLQYFACYVLASTPITISILCF